MTVQQPTPAVAPVAAAGLLLAARTLAGAYGLRSPSAKDIVEATGAARSRAYEVRDEISRALPTLVRPVGRPPKPEVPERSTAEARAEIAGEVLAFLMAHPGCAHAGKKSCYADAFRRFILELRARFDAIDLRTFSAATKIPLGTLEDWLRPGAKVEDVAAPPTAPRESAIAQVETVLSAWSQWHGNFTDFAKHVRRDLRLDYGNSLLSNILFEHDARRPKRRPGRTPDEEATRGTFETFFGGAQWVGDGKQLVITIDGEEHHFNLELFVDAHSDAWVGIDVRDNEDADAVVAAFEAGTQTTGSPAIAALLDNKPSNHCDTVDQALGDTLRIRATLFRAQNKAHVEGAFGLFSQELPPINLSTSDPHALARDVLFLTSWYYACGLNRRPRRDRNGRSRIDLYNEPVSDAEREAATDRLRERLKRQQQQRLTRRARLDPVLCALLDDAFARLALEDPERHFRDAIARHGRDHIVEGLAIFDGKRRAGTLPDRVDARYLLGIVKNLEHVHEAHYITQALIEYRLDVRDRSLEPLVRERQLILSSGVNTSDQLRDMVEQIAESTRSLDTHFWSLAIADLISATPPDAQAGLFKFSAQLIHASFSLPHEERAAITQRIARRLWPVD